MPDNTPDDVKKVRLSRVKEVLKASTIAKTNAMLGKTLNVLVEKVSDRDSTMLIASADNTRLVQFVGDASLIGQFTTVKVTDIRSMNLVQAELVG